MLKNCHFALSSETITDVIVIKVNADNDTQASFDQLVEYCWQRVYTAVSCAAAAASSRRAARELSSERRSAPESCY